VEAGPFLSLLLTNGTEAELATLRISKAFLMALKRPEQKLRLF